MKKTALILLTILFLGSLTAPAFAGGDQNNNRHKGEKGNGTVKQVQVNKK